MCGIVGFTNKSKTIKNPQQTLINMRDKLIKRGEDTKGKYILNDVYLGHRRLSIRDIENGKQPMTFKYNNNQYTIVYN